MRSRSSRSAAGWLLRKEWRELMSSRAWWVMFALTGPLVGVMFSNAVRTYADVSEGAGAGCGAVCDPLIGIWAPTFGAFEIVAIFLLPFVAIRLVSGDRQSGALKLELQRPMPAISRLAVKTLVLLAGCGLAAMAGMVAVALWLSYGGSVYWPELAVVSFGYFLHAGLTIAITTVAATIAEHPSTAAIATLGFTVGTWIVEFAAAIRGGIWTDVARFTPSSMIAIFQHGLLPASTVLVTLVLTAGGLFVGAAWLRLDEPPRRRVVRSLIVVVLTAVGAWTVSHVTVNRDVSEGRLNSFSKADQAALEGIDQPIRIEAHLAPEDPRRLDLERHAIAKLRRAVPAADVAFVSRTRTGLFEQTDPNYGEIRYSVGSRTVVGRATTDEAVLEGIYEAAEMEPDRDAEPPFMGHPLVARPVGAGVAFYGVWPSLAALAAWLATRQRGPSR